MKRYKFLLMLIAVMQMISLTSCDSVAEEDRLIYVAPAEANKAVLIEDFTGQKCVNCPNATAEIDKLLETYSEDVIIPVAIHSGPFGRRTPLYTELGDVYWNHWFSDTQGQPVVKINRGAVTDDIPSITTLVTDALSKTTTVSLDVNCIFNSENHQLTIETDFHDIAPSTAKLQLWLTEDSIVGTQKKPDGTTDKNYAHMHVLREAINGEWGEGVSINAFQQTISHTCTLSDSYNSDNCYVVAFLYNDQEGVMQVVRVKVNE